MDVEKSVSLDETTAKLIDEMDKSLHNMEHSLGIDHPVVAKILDSYAKLLTQNHIRPLDALNMQARAKAIRAKHNQREAEEQSLGLETRSEAKSGISVGQLRFAGWIIALVVLVGLGVCFMNTLKQSEQMKLKHPLSKNRRFTLSNMPMIGSAGTGIENGGREPSANEIGGVPASENAGGNRIGEQFQSITTQTAQETDAKTGEATKSVNTTNDTQQVNSTNDPELAEVVAKIKDQAREQLSIGLAAEKNQDYHTATDAYSSVIKLVQNAETQLGRAVCSEEIAQCMEGYARMAELDSHPEVAKGWKDSAQQVRQHIND